MQPGKRFSLLSLYRSSPQQEMGWQQEFAQHAFFPQFFSSLVWSLIGWILWSVISLFIGTTIFKGKGDLIGMLRGIGFSYVPQALSIIPCIGSLAGFLWSLAAGFIAVGQELSLDSIKALLTIIIGFGLFLLGHAIINSVLGGFQWFMTT